MQYKKQNIRLTDNDDMQNRLAYNFALVRLEKLSSKLDSFEWIKNDYNYKSDFDFCFVSGKTVFCVVLDILNKDGKVSLSKKVIKDKLSYAKKYNFVVCRFPILFDKTLKPKSSSRAWNLYELDSDKEVIPEDIVKLNLPSDVTQLRRYKGMQFIKDFINKESNILNMQDIDLDEPLVWFNDKSAKNSFLIAQIVDKNDNVLFGQNKDVILSKYKDVNGYEIKLLLQSFNGKMHFSIVSYGTINRVDNHNLLNYKKLEKENIYNLILATIKQNSISEKKIIGIYPIVGYENLLLKIHSVLVENIDILDENLKLVPYDFNEDLKNNPHFGLPLYYVTSKTSKYANLDKVEFENTILFNETNTIILKRVSGKSVMSAYFDNFIKLVTGANLSIQKELNKLLNIRWRYGQDAAEQVLNMLTDGIYSVSQNKLANGSIQYKFENNNEFILIYNDFSQNYISTLKLISEMEQSAYDKAIENILMPKNFVFDFINPNNTMVDFENNEFNFIDFMYDENIVSSISKNLQVEYFKKTLFGVNNKKTYTPQQLIFRKYDIAQINNFDSIITNKINNAVINHMRKNIV